MRSRRRVVAVAQLCGTLLYAGCTLFQGLDGLTYDVGSDAGDDASCAPTGYTCGAPPPAGWSGPVAVYEGPPGTAPDCPSDYPAPAVDGGTGLDAGPAKCGACTCSTPAATCPAAPLDLYSTTGCTGSPAKTLSLAPGTCTPATGASQFIAEAPQASVDACEPSGGAPSVPPPTWTSEGVACTLAGQGTTCADGSLCAPRAAAPFEARWCIWKVGAETCPPGFPERRVWQTATDARGCTPCSCGAPVPVTCATTTELYADMQCQKPIIALPAAQCTQKGGVQAAMTITDAGASSCPASGGAPTGSATATAVATICCPK